MPIPIQHGLPAGLKDEEFVRNERTGSLTVSSLTPEQCLSILEQVHRKRFLNRQIFVTSVVEDSPVKAPPAEASNATKPEAEADPEEPALVDPVTGIPDPKYTVNSNTGARNKDIPVQNSLNQLTLFPTAEPSNALPNSDKLEGFVFGLVSPGIQNKISQIEGLNKRKSESSPEASDLSRKEKKILREEERRQKKIEKKTEQKEKTKVVTK